MDNNTDTTWEKKLFTLGLLLSSYFIFNSQGTPTFGDLDKLAFVGKFREYLESSRACKRNNRFKPLGSSPDFLWLVRDAYLQPEVQGERCSWSRYLKESVLKSRPCRRNDPTDLVREAVVKTFGKIDAYGIPFPSLDANVLQKLGSPESTNMTQPAFKKSILSVKKKIFALAKEKTVNGRILSGKDLATFLEAFVEQLNSETGIIDVESTFECFVGVEEAETVYTNEMELLREKMPCSALVVRKCHNDAKKKAGKKLSDRTKLSSHLAREIHIRKFDLTLENELKSYQSENKLLSHDHCQKITKHLLSKYLQPMFDDPSNFRVKAIRDTKDKILEKYCLLAQGPKSDEIRFELMTQMTSKTIEIEKLIVHEATKKSLDLYERELLAFRLPCEKCHLDKKHEKTLELAINTFEELCSGGETKYPIVYKQSLEADIHDKINSIVKNNDRLSFEKCEKIMNNLIKRHLNPLLDDLYHNNYKTLLQAVRIIFDSYDSTAVGPKSEFVRKQGERKVNSQLEQSQVHIAQITRSRASTIYSNHMQQLKLPCSEILLFLGDKGAREKAFEKLTTDLSNFPISIIQSEEQELEWLLTRSYSSLMTDNMSRSRQQCQRLVNQLEELHHLNVVLGDWRLRDEATVGAIVERILRDYMARAKGPAAIEIQKEIQAKYYQKLQQCAKESLERKASLAAGVIVAGGLALLGLGKILGGKKSGDDD